MPKSRAWCLALIVVSCQTENFAPVVSIPENIEPYVETFIQEAAARGKNIQIDNLVIHYSGSLGATCGQCNSTDLTSAIQRIIDITENSTCWNNDQEFEALVFHELGHCVLGRVHNEELLPNAAPKSLMIANQLDVYSPCVYDLGGGTPCNKLDRRQYYLDELFDPATPVPDWAN
jgi:hypothetical protein